MTRKFLRREHRLVKVAANSQPSEWVTSAQGNLQLTGTLRIFFSPCTETFVPTLKSFSEWGEDALTAWTWWFTYSWPVNLILHLPFFLYIQYVTVFSSHSLFFPVVIYTWNDFWYLFIYVQFYLQWRFTSSFTFFFFFFFLYCKWMVC